MSYATMDHADWVQRQIGPAKQQLGKKRRSVQKGWAAAPEALTPFQERVFDILGMTFGGIYNAPIAWDALQWHWGHGLAVPVMSPQLATFDFDRLTRLVFLCHEARIRCEVTTHSFRYLLLTFHPREAVGTVGKRHPNLDEAVASFRQYLPQGHRIVSEPRAPATPAAEEPSAKAVAA